MSLGVTCSSIFSGNAPLSASKLPELDFEFSYRTVQLDNGHEARMVVKPVEIGGRRVIVRVFRAIDHIARDVNALLRVYLILLPVAITFSYGVAWMISRRLIRPIETLGTLMQRADVRSLADHVDADAFDRELGLLARQYNEIMRRIEHGVTALERFSSDAAHEMRTPLMAMQATAEAVLLDADPENAKQSLHLILFEIRHLAGLIDRLLQLSRADRGELVVARTPIHVSDLISEAAQSMAPLLKKQQRAIYTSIETSCKNYESTFLQGYQTLCHQTLVNLIENAIKHGAGDIDIVSRCIGQTATHHEPHGAEWIEIDVCDRGPAFPATTMT